MKPARERNSIKKIYRSFMDYHTLKIPAILGAFSVIFSTAFLDFNVGDFKLKSHMTILVNLIDKPQNNVAAMYLFFIILASAIGLATSFAFIKKTSIPTALFSSLITLVQVTATILYIMVFVNEMAIRPSVRFDQPMALALITITISTILSLISCITIWILVFKTKKVSEYFE